MRPRLPCTPSTLANDLPSSAHETHHPALLELDALSPQRLRRTLADGERLTTATKVECPANPHARVV